MRQDLTSTTFEIPGRRVIKSLGVVRGLTVRLRSVVGSFVGGLQTILGGNITIYAEPAQSTMGRLRSASPGMPGTNSSPTSTAGFCVAALPD